MVFQWCYANEARAYGRIRPASPPLRTQKKLAPTPRRHDADQHPPGAEPSRSAAFSRIGSADETTVFTISRVYHRGVDRLRRCTIASGANSRGEFRFIDAVD